MPEIYVISNFVKIFRAVLESVILAHLIINGDKRQPCTIYLLCDSYVSWIQNDCFIDKDNMMQLSAIWDTSEIWD